LDAAARFTVFVQKRIVVDGSRYSNFI